MTQGEFNQFCSRLAHATHVVQWGGADVWKIGGKVFAIGNSGHGAGSYAIVFKVSEMAWEILRDTPGCRPAPYLASRGLKWIQRLSSDAVDDASLREYIADSYAIVGRGLTKKLQRTLGLLDSRAPCGSETKQRT